jgi:hypothetical protein
LRSRTVEIHYEQAVYGSFPFWDRGYAVLAESPGCRPEWVAGLRAACQRFGERPGGVDAVGGLFALRPAGGPWMIVGVGSPGSDDRGRPGALAFHALFVSPRDYRRAGCNPFAFAGALRDDWTAATRDLPAGTWTVTPAGPPIGPIDPRAADLVSTLIRGRRVAIEAAGPIDALARQVWHALPEGVRRRATVATWAFGNGNRFDLVAVPRLAGLEFDRSYVDLAAIEAGSPSSVRGADRWVALLRPGRRALAVSVVAGLVAAGLAWRGIDGSKGSRIPTHETPGSVDPEPPVGPEERARIVDGLEAMADRFEAFEIGRWGDPSELMARISDRLRYRGATLLEADRDRLAADPDPDRDRALAWHDRIKAFANDRPLPGDFARLPLRRQLDEFARSFHLDPPPRSDAIPEFVAEALSRDGPIRPTPLASRYPALSDYARFLGRLPRGSRR